MTTIDIFINMEIWFPSRDHFKPENIAEHSTLGKEINRETEYNPSRDTKTYNVRRKHGSMERLMENKVAIIIYFFVIKYENCHSDMK